MEAHKQAPCEWQSGGAQGRGGVLCALPYVLEALELLRPHRRLLFLFRLAYGRPSLQVSLSPMSATALSCSPRTNVISLSPGAGVMEVWPKSNWALLC